MPMPASSNPVQIDSAFSGCMPRKIDTSGHLRNHKLRSTIAFWRWQQVRGPRHPEGPDSQPNMSEVYYVLGGDGTEKLGCERPGIGVELDFKQLKQVAEITEPVTAGAQTYFRPDGSITDW